MNPAVLKHCAELERCNQRGGRMLSMVDLLNAGTVTLDLAAYLMARMTLGASIMVGALPGGAGKTTVMGALLNLAHRDIELKAATAQAVRDAPGGKACYVCHEIGNGPYFAYLWGADLRAYCALSARGHLLATNLHADDLDKAHAQVCTQNNVPERHFNAFHVILFLRVSGGGYSTQRRVSHVYASDGYAAHERIFSDGILRATPGAEVDHLARCRAFLEELRGGHVCLIELIRERLIARDEFFQTESSSSFI